MSQINWYDSESWYRPLHTPQPAARQEQPKKKRRWPWIAGILGLALLLIIGSSIAFRDRSPEKPSAPESQKPSADPELPEDWKQFFGSYFESIESTAVEIKIERADTPIDFSVEAAENVEGELTLQELYESCAHAVVGISGYVGMEVGYSWGSGVIISSDGLIVTNTHVIDGCDRATVTLYDDSEYEAKLVGADVISDIAVLKIEGEDLPTAVFGQSEYLLVGEHVAAIGNPLGESFRMTMTDGIISAIERGINYNGRTMTLLQTNTAINEGNSGGALFNMDGQVVGITNMKMMSSGTSIEGIGFAIPSSTVCQVVNAILKDGEYRGRASIGITVGAISERYAEQYDLPGGLLITAVSAGSDAEAQGILPYDILLAVNGEEVATTEDVSRIKDQFGVGDKLTLTIWRDGKTFDVEVMLMDTIDVYG